MWKQAKENRRRHIDRQEHHHRRLINPYTTQESQGSGDYKTLLSAASRLDEMEVGRVGIQESHCDILDVSSKDEKNNDVTFIATHWP